MTVAWGCNWIAEPGWLAETPPSDFRLFLGYAGWGSGQLMQEILRNDWLTAPVRPDLIFASDPEQVWDDALRSVGPGRSDKGLASCEANPLIFLVGRTGFEPVTNGLKVRCSTS